MARRPNILLVENRVLARDALKQALAEANYEVVSCLHGTVATLRTAQEPAQLQRRADVSPAQAAQRPDEDVTAAQSRRVAAPTTMATLYAILAN